MWSLSGSEGVSSRTRKLIGEADEEAILVLGAEELVGENLFDALNRAIDRGVSVVVGTLTQAMCDRVGSAVDDAEVFVTELDWLRDPGTTEQPEATAIGRLLLVDRNTILVSSYEPASGRERAVFGRGFGNGLVIVVRRMLASGLLQINDPAAVAADTVEGTGAGSTE